MHLRKNITSVAEILKERRSPLPAEPGIYAFWWLAERSELISANRKIILKGPGGTDVEVEYRDWWAKHLRLPCLYVGKTTNIRKRFGLHIKSGTPGRLHVAHPQHHKARPKTTSCQLRWGIEHVFPAEENPLTLIKRAVGFSYNTDFPENAIAERFFEEDRLVGLWRPWFNIDSER